MNDILWKIKQRLCTIS